jgi:hypothetical protein
MGVIEGANLVQKSRIKCQKIAILSRRFVPSCSNLRLYAK